MIMAIINCTEYNLPDGRNFCSFGSLLCIPVPRIILSQNILSKYLLNEYNTFLMYKNMLLSISNVKSGIDRRKVEAKDKSHCNSQVRETRMCMNKTMILKILMRG